ncbi:MAG: hypothetical protein M3P52_11550 [Actinomycetota bacterium]|nr:hypothetical protein [Actinomycetota bacterium]
MPSRRRPKAPPPPPLSDAARFAQSIRDSEEADRRAKQAIIDRKTEAERRRTEAIEQAANLERAQAAHQRSVELVKEAKRSGKGAAAADLAWREAKADLIELETGQRPAWAARPAEPPESPTSDESDAADTVVGSDGDGD